MAAIVRKGYIVICGGKRYEEGMEIPSSVLKDVVEKQSWKVEVKDGKKEEGKEVKRQKEEKLEDISSNRMVGDSLTKKRG